MSWITLAVLSALVLAIVNILDGHFISRRLPGVRIYLMLVGIMILFFSIILTLLFPLTPGIPGRILAIAVLSCFIRVSGVLIMLFMLSKIEVSRVVPVVYSYPVFVAILAIPLLGEHLVQVEWLAIIMVVAGTIILSFQRTETSSSIQIKPFVLLLGSSLLLALADISSKYVLDTLAFQQLVWLNSWVLSLACLAIGVRKFTFRQFGELQNKPGLLSFIFCNELIALGSNWLLLQAIQKGPVSLVSTISATRPVFVLLYAIILSRFLPGFLIWQQGLAMIVIKVMATVMIVGGIAIIYLT